MRSAFTFALRNSLRFPSKFLLPKNKKKKAYFLSYSSPPPHPTRIVSESRAPSPTTLASLLSNSEHLALFPIPVLISAICALLSHYSPTHALVFTNLVRLFALHAGSHTRTVSSPATKLNVNVAFASSQPKPTIHSPAAPVTTVIPTCPHPSVIPRKTSPLSLPPFRSRGVHTSPLVSVLLRKLVLRI